MKRRYFRLACLCRPCYLPAMQRFDAIILGGGASGLCCAMHAARRGVSVAVADHSAKPARKVRISGGGKGNFTNLHVTPDNYLCANPHFVKSALARHTPWDVIDFFTAHGVTYEERDHGQLFTLEGAGRLAGILAEQCTRLGVTFFLGDPVDVADGSAPYRVKAGADEFAADKLVIALGGPSWPQAGASDFGFRLAQRFGLSLIPPRPGLVGLAFPKKLRPLCRDLSGNALPATVATGEAAFTDPLLFTHTGISGPATLQASSYWREGRSVIIDFLPGQPLAELIEAHRSSNVQLKNLLARVLPKRLPAHLLSVDEGELPVSQLSKGRIETVTDRVHRFTFTPAGTEGFAKAEVTVGGVDTDEISSKTFEARNVPGLHVVGETLDVAGHLGGFNLHWAFASGAACGAGL